MRVAQTLFQIFRLPLSFVLEKPLIHASFFLMSLHSTTRLHLTLPNAIRCPVPPPNVLSSPTLNQIPTNSLPYWKPSRRTSPLPPIARPWGNERTLTGGNHKHTTGLVL